MLGSQAAARDIGLVDLAKKTTMFRGFCIPDLIVRYNSDHNVYFPNLDCLNNLLGSMSFKPAWAITVLDIGPSQCNQSTSWGRQQGDCIQSYDLQSTSKFGCYANLDIKFLMNETKSFIKCIYENILLWLFNTK